MTIIKKRDRWYIIDRALNKIAGGFETRQEAVSKLAEIKAAMKAERAAKKQREERVKELKERFEKQGIPTEGTTAGGKKYRISHNLYGFTKRTDNCWQMAIEDEGTVFASGTIETVARYILTH